MYWTYLMNTNPNGSNELLTFETINDCSDCEQLKKILKDYHKLIADDFFSSFYPYYDTLIVSEYDPTQNPSKNPVKIKIKINDIDGAKKFLDLTVE